MTEGTLYKDKTYVCVARAGMAIFRPRQTVNVSRKPLENGGFSAVITPNELDPDGLQLPYIQQLLSVHGLSNMNSHWQRKEFRRTDGENTWPWLPCKKLSLASREWRPATEVETAMLDECIRRGHALTEEEIKIETRDALIKSLYS